MTVAGGCLCKAVRYEFAAQPIATRMRWCRSRQYLGAGNATVNIAFPKSAARISGALRDCRSVADSGAVMRRSFCPTCGTPMFSEAESRPHLIFVRVGALDDPEIGRPVAAIWTSQAPSWACIDESMPRIELQPPPVA